MFKAVVDSPRARALRAHATLGVIRLDYNYPPAPGDIDSPDSFSYGVFYRVVPGLTFEMCQSGQLTQAVQKAFIDAVVWLDQTKGVSAITGDCGFMFWFQDLARQHTDKPVFMSSLVQLPSIVSAYSKREQIAIFTANIQSLEPMYDLIKEECGIGCDSKRFEMVGCQDVPGFEAVAVAAQLDLERVRPGIVALAQRVVQENPHVRAFLLECTQLPPFSDDIRHATGLPVYDAITCSNMFIEGLLDNPRFGLNAWQEEFNGLQQVYTLGDNLTEEERKLLISVQEEQRQQQQKRQQK